MEKLKIAILGATSHIAKGLINNFFCAGNCYLDLYTRQSDKTRDFIDKIGKTLDKNYAIHDGYHEFFVHDYDVLINCVGVGTINKLEGDYSRYFTVTEKYDNLAIQYLQQCNTKALYVSFSSGAVYGNAFLEPANENTINHLRVNHMMLQNSYSIARLNAEAKHRSLPHLNIVDLRIFSYFSRFIDLTDHYFITDILNCVLQKKIFKTSSAEMVRDYIHPEDLFSLIQKCENINQINGVLDVVSLQPAAKQEILDYFSAEYGLKYEIDGTLGYASATGSKIFYYSTFEKVSELGYKPKFSAMDTIKRESKYILEGNERNEVN